jgi:acetyl esterase/lipase
MRALALFLFLTSSLFAQTPTQSPNPNPPQSPYSTPNQPPDANNPQNSESSPGFTESTLPAPGQSPAQNQDQAQPQNPPPGQPQSQPQNQTQDQYQPQNQPPSQPQAQPQSQPLPTEPPPSQPAARNDSQSPYPIPAQTVNPSSAPSAPAPAKESSSADFTLPLWPTGAPGGQATTGPETNTTTLKDSLIAGRPIIRLANVSNPTLTFYPADGINTGAAVVVFPGGGYQILAMDLEGTEPCNWLNSIGVNCVAVKYRVPNSGPYPKSPAALEDAQRALGLVRQHAAEWGIDPHRIGVLGFSAGAHLAAALSTHFEQRIYAPVDAADQLSCRPDFALIVYPGYLAIAEENFAPNPDIHLSAQTPPTFLLQAEDDPVHVENAVTYFTELKQAGVPAELHIYAQGGHGYGLRPTNLPITDWPHLAEIWLHTINVLQND